MKLIKSLKKKYEKLIGIRCKQCGYKAGNHRKDCPTIKPRVHKAICNDCLNLKNCIPAENLKPDNTCENFSKKS